MVKGRKLVLNAKQLRKGTGNPSTTSTALSTSSLRTGRVQGIVKRNEIYIVLDNVLDTYNIGSIFRLADATASKKIYLCGGTETPPNSRIKKASINTTEWVEWEWCESAVEAIAHLRGEAKKSSGSHLGGEAMQIVAVEQTPKSIQYDKFEYKMPICLVVGHESDGVSKEVLEMADAVVELPMFGVNKSLNVMVSLGIVLYQIIEKTQV